MNPDAFKPAIVYTIYIKASAEQVWTALTSAEFSKRYFSGFAVELEERVGGTFIVRAPDDPTGVIFRGAANEVRLLRRNGMWWLYENRHRMQMPACPPLEPDRQHTPVLDTRW